MRIPHVLVECIEKIPSVIVGVMTPLQSLQDKRLLEVRFIRTIEITAEDIAWCDTLVCVRGCEIVDLCIVKAARKAQKQVIYFLDDDLLDIPEDVSCSTYFSDSFIRETIVKLMEVSDILWAVNPNIIKKYGHLFKKSILADACASEIKELKETPDFPAQFIYAGSIDHENVVREKLSDSIRKIADEYGDRVRFTFIGVNPNLSDIGQVNYIPYIADYYQYKKLMNESGFQISFAIIRKTPFYRSKYFNKFLEYSSIGAIGIYSKTEPYTFVVEHGVNGFLCEDNSPDDWYEAMKFLIDHPDQRKAMSKEAYRQLCERFTPETVGMRLTQLIPELIDYYAPELSQKIRINHNYIIIRFYLHRAKLIIAEHGIKALVIIPIKAIKVIFKLLINRIKGS